MAHDPFDTPGDRFRAVARHWKTGLIGLVVLALLVERGFFLTTGKDHLVRGEIMTIDAAKHASVRLGEAQQATVALPAQTNCHVGSTIQLIRRDSATDRAYRPATTHCDS